MIHVDVRREKDTDIRASGMPKEWRPRYYVETSRDGAGWSTHYTVFPLVNETDADTRSRAEIIARAFLAGVRYTGADARGTSCGYGL